MISQKQAMRQACIDALGPLVKILLENGMTHKEFSELCKFIFIDMAQKNYGIRGRLANTAKVSALTGIDRKQIKRITDKNAQGDEWVIDVPLDKLTRILSAWFEDAMYLSSTGRPAELPLEATSGEPSLMGLIKRFCGDVPATTLFRELKQNGSIKEEKGLWSVQSREYINSKADAESILRTGKVIKDLGAIIHYNLYVSDDETLERRFERRTTNENIPIKYEKEFNEILRHEGQKFLDELDKWLMDKQVENVSSDDKKYIRLGVGMYYISSDNN